MKKICLQTLFLITCLLVAGIELKAQENSEKLNFYGSFRFRVESDRNSEKTDGSERPDRDRLRYRFRFGVRYQLNSNVEFGGRLRSGSSSNPQSPHVTLGDGFSPDEISIDKAYIQVKSNDGYWARAGKAEMPFWKQNEFLWDSDVNPEGISVGGKFNITENATFQPLLGYFVTMSSGQEFSDDSDMTFIQLKYDARIGNNPFVFATGLISLRDAPFAPYNATGEVLDYKIWASNMQLNLKNTGLKLGADYFSNLENYDGITLVDDIFKDEKFGFVGSLLYSSNNWQFGYYYAHIEKLAVVDYLAQDDWVRWGSNEYTRSSNFKGHEFRIKHRISTSMDALLRAYFVKGIETSGIQIETGTRIRLDINIKF